MLSASNVTVERAGLPVVRDVSFLLRPGKVCALLGVNGAGKTTLLESLSGVLPIARGTVKLNGQMINSWSSSRRAKRGIAHVEEGRSVFPGMTTEENLRVSVPNRGDVGPGFELFPELQKRRHVRAGLLSGGEQQMLVVARAYLRRPDVFLFDELSLGLAPAVVTRILNVVRGLADEGKSVLLVEQFASLALEISDHALVMSGGDLVFDEDAGALRGEEALLQQLYLGNSIARVEGGGK